MREQILQLRTLKISELWAATVKRIESTIMNHEWFSAFFRSPSYRQAFGFIQRSFQGSEMLLSWSGPDADLIRSLFEDELLEEMLMPDGRLKSMSRRSMPNGWTGVIKKILPDVVEALCHNQQCAWDVAYIVSNLPIRF